MTEAVPPQSLSWLDSAAQLFFGALENISDDALGAPSALPTWTKTHLLAHVHYNALALSRLVTWADTGVPTPMYESVDQRAAEIAHGATLSAAELRRLALESADTLRRDLGDLHGRPGLHQVTTIQGRTLDADQLPWLRTRELLVHAVDLDAGVGFEEAPAELLRALIDDILVKRGAGELPAVAAWLSGRAGSTAPPSPWL